MNPQILFIGVFSVFAMIVSPLCGFLIGNSFGHILFITVLSVVAFAVLGFGVHAILEMKVPEFLDFLSNLGGDFVPTASDSESSRGGGFDYTSQTNEEELSGGSSSNKEVFASATPKRQKSGNFGDHIMVENIAIKNEPKLMAEAIRTMLARDDMAEK
ncbi:hypothetical protein [Leptospira alstonii]|uniref:Uncharacterized protein n=2 Tax=Leptospira alstonii TaxID=28452 RepID=M6CY81_9LEPT|nr:hypothetical protein [Leptospira alstonii]EMJ96842.1 hypothetical protein LEP1GSC194_2023 [Leptospira alstonii serovar Sichuan str. 79601]EQA80014.1 hypothetical protein LEP1GSC193_0621 [Leptospira alstonii serovar Pingchang str. 80-412]